MADNKMNKIKFNSPVQIPDLVVEKIIAQDLTVKGTTTTENSVDNLQATTGSFSGSVSAVGLTSSDGLTVTNGRTSVEELYVADVLSINSSMIALRVLSGDTELQDTQVESLTSKGDITITDGVLKLGDVELTSQQLHDIIRNVLGV